MSSDIPFSVYIPLLPSNVHLTFEGNIENILNHRYKHS